MYCCDVIHRKKAIIYQLFSFWKASEYLYVVNYFCQRHFIIVLRAFSFQVKTARGEGILVVAVAEKALNCYMCIKTGFALLTNCFYTHIYTRNAFKVMRHYERKSSLSKALSSYFPRDVVTLIFFFLSMAFYILQRIIVCAFYLILSPSVVRKKGAFTLLLSPLYPC